MPGDNEKHGCCGGNGNGGCCCCRVEWAMWGNMNALYGAASKICVYREGGVLNQLLYSPPLCSFVYWCSCRSYCGDYSVRQ